jgi:hypothetical protein
MRIAIAALAAIALVSTASADFVTVKNKDSVEYDLRVKSSTGGNTDRTLGKKGSITAKCDPACTLILTDSDSEFEASAGQTVIVEGGAFSAE